MQVLDNIGTFELKIVMDHKFNDIPNRKTWYD